MEVRTLHLDGVIASECWFDDDITPQLFSDDLHAGQGDIEVWINSPGGDCVAAAQIYNMLMDYSGNVTIKIDGIAASAASVIAMAGTQTLVSPTSMLMIHNPFTLAQGDADELQKVIEMLNEVKESIINAYELKTGLSRAKISHMMDDETWLNANKAVDLGFADGIMFQNKAKTKEDDEPDETQPEEEDDKEGGEGEEDDEKKKASSNNSYAYSQRQFTSNLLSTIYKAQKIADGSVDAEQLNKRLNLLSH